MISFLYLLNKSRRFGDKFKPSEFDIENAKSPIIDNIDWGFRKKELQFFFKYVRQVMEKRPEMSNADISEEFQTTLNDTLISLTNLIPFKNDSIMLELANYFMSNQTEFQALYRELVNKEDNAIDENQYNNNYQYSSVFEEAKKQFVENMFVSFRGERNSIEDEDTRQFFVDFARLNNKQKKAILAEYSEEDQEFIKAYVKFFVKPEVAGMMEYFHGMHERLELEVKQGYAQSINIVVNTLDELGYLDLAVNQHNGKMKKNGIPELAITKEELLDAYDILSEDNVAKSSVMKLASINSFWINRLAKAVGKFNYCLFAVDTLNLWDEIRDAKLFMRESNGDVRQIESDEFDYTSSECMVDFELSPDQIDALDEKIRFLQYRFNIHFSQAIQELKEQKNAGADIDFTEPLELDIDSQVEEEADKIQFGYRKYFSKVNEEVLAKGENDYKSDFNVLACGENLRLELYDQKSNILGAQLFSMFNMYPPPKNWGILLNKGQSLEKKNMIIIAMDIPGLNMPVRLHISKSKVIDFLKSNGYDLLFPVYQGNLDFKTDSFAFKVITTPVLMPSTEQYKSKVKKALENHPEGDPRHNFLKHIEFLFDGVDIPDHMKDTEIETKTVYENKKGSKRGKKRTINKEKKVFKRRYYDFGEDKVYVENIHASKGSQTKYLPDEDYLR